MAKKTNTVRIGNWMWTLLLNAIPGVNVIFWIVTAFATRKPSKRSWAIANIIWFLIAAALVVCTVVFFGDQILQGLIYLTTTPVTELSASGFFRTIFGAK